jgi:hypothetical protein
MPTAFSWSLLSLSHFVVEFSDFQVNNFGFVSLSIHPTYPEDEGTYTCLLRNSLGETLADARLTTVATEALQLDPLHAEALPTIQSIEDYQVGC